MNVKRVFSWITGAALALGTVPAAIAQDDAAAATITPKGTPSAEALGWHVGCQAYTFNRFSFYEAIDKVKALNLQ